ncbi:MAG: MlaC/ttg2D family ABC transporter substrate-binding protein [Planctomycetota bacterium]|jgi:phospholipid transport system substrate-binding protein
MRRVWLCFLVLLICVQVVGAGEKESGDPNYPSDPNVLLRTKWDAVACVLRNKQIDPNTKIAQINKIVYPIFDFPLIAKLSLGKKHWPKLTPVQRKKFTFLFTEKLRTSYREKITLFKDEKAHFKPAVQKKKNTLEIPMELISGGKKVSILYKLRRAEYRIEVKVGEQCQQKLVKRWKIYDVEIEGISLLRTYRSQFDDILRSGTVEDLLSRLEKPATE